MIKFIAGLFIGIIGILFVWLMVNSLTVTPESRKCMTQQVHLVDTRSSSFIIVGETVICARDWQISNIYGPDAEAFYGKIKLREWDSHEFTTERINDP